MTRRRVAAGALLAATVVASTVACTGSSRTDADYRSKVANTAQTLDGVVATAQLVAGQATQGRLTTPFAAQALTESEEDASSILSGFTAVQPPSRATSQLRRRVTAVGRRIESVLSDLVTDARRGELDRLSDTAAPLAALRRELAPMRHPSEAA